jgi:hypothetical protein
VDSWHAGEPGNSTYRNSISRGSSYSAAWRRVREFKTGDVPRKQSAAESSRCCGSNGRWSNAPLSMTKRVCFSLVAMSWPTFLAIMRSWDLWIRVCRKLVLNNAIPSTRRDTVAKIPCNPAAWVSALEYRERSSQSLAQNKFLCVTTVTPSSCSPGNLRLPFTDCLTVRTKLRERI